MFGADLVPSPNDEVDVLNDVGFERKGARKERVRMSAVLPGLAKGSPGSVSPIWGVDHPTSVSQEISLEFVVAGRE